MLEKRKRITKKEMKQDTLVTTYYKVYNFFLEHQAKILIGAAAVALVVIGIVLISNKKSDDNLKAANLLAKVAPIYEAGLYKQAIEGQPAGNIIGLKEIVNKYGSTEQGENAKIYLANSYLLTGKEELAFNIYEDYGGSNPLFQATSLAGEANHYEFKKEYEKAIDLYKAAAKISIGNPSNAEFLLKAGINLLKLGKKEEAKTIFDNIKKDYRLSPVVQEIDRYLIQIES